MDGHLAESRDDGCAECWPCRGCRGCFGNSQGTLRVGTYRMVLDIVDSASLPGRSPKVEGQTHVAEVEQAM